MILYYICFLKLVQESDSQKLYTFSYDSKLFPTPGFPSHVRYIPCRYSHVRRLLRKTARIKLTAGKIKVDPLSPDDKLVITLPQYDAVRGWVNAFPTDGTPEKLGLDECIGRQVRQNKTV